MTGVKAATCIFLQEKYLSGNILDLGLKEISIGKLLLCDKRYGKHAFHNIPHSNIIFLGHLKRKAFHCCPVVPRSRTDKA